jgi:PST family polysaccharide transporter
MPASFKRKVAVGIAWTTAARAAARILGLVSTLILARLLTPADFGLVAIAMAIAAGLELLTLFGFDAALIQRKEITREHYDTAWTLNLLLGAGLACALAIAAVPVAAFYRDPRLEAIMYIIGGKYIIEHAGNPGVVDFRRNITFRPDFVIQVLPKLIAILITIPAAFLLRDYRALLIGMLISSSSTFLLSYLLHKHRPRWCLAEARVLYNFSRWLLLNNFINYLRNRSADLIIGRALGPGPLGVFSIGSEVSNLPTTDMVAPINRVLFPSYVQLAADLNRLRDAFRTTLGLIAIAALPASVGVAAVADPLVRVMLGEKWLEAIPVISLLALAGASTVLQTNTGALLNALGKPRLIALTGAIQVALLFPMLLFATWRFGLLGAASAVLLHAMAFGLPITYLIVCRNAPVRVGDIVDACWRPVAASAVMYGTVWVLLKVINAPTTLTGSLAALLSACAIGALTYVAALLLLWQMAGRPQGSESLLIDRIRPALARLGTTVNRRSDLK